MRSGFLCDAQNVVGGAAYQVLLAQMVARKRLVEANAKVALGETPAALIAPGFAWSDPCAQAVSRGGHMGRGQWRPQARLEDRTLSGPAWLAGTWQFLQHVQIAVLILFATREIRLPAGAIGVAYASGDLASVLASMSAQRLSARFGIGPVIIHGLMLTRQGGRPSG